MVVLEQVTEPLLANDLAQRERKDARLARIVGLGHRRGTNPRDR